MHMGWMESLIYGIVMGLTDILPVSDQAHSRILLKFMGWGFAPALLNLFVHLGILGAVFLSCQPQLLKMLRAQKMSRIPKRSRKRPLDKKSLMDLHLLETMLVPVVLAFVFLRKVQSLTFNLIIVATFLFLNGLALYIPQFLPSCNKDSRNLSRVEGLLMGLGGSLFAIPGFSGMGGALSVASVAGVEQKYGLTMILLMEMVILGGKSIFDVLDLLAAGFGGLTFLIFVCYLLAGCAAFLGAFIAIRVLNALTSSRGFALFACYSWGLALFTFILSLMA